MYRTALTLAALMTAAPAPAQDTAQDSDQDMIAECATQAAVVMQLVTARTEGAGVEEAATRTGDALPGTSEKYASVLPMLADWVYTLPEDQLGPAVGESWSAACLGQ